MNRLFIAFACLFVATPALAEPLEFSTDPGPALNIARSLMSAERGTPLSEEEPVTIALYDFDGDGTRDILAFADASYFCGTAGCIPRLYRLERSTGKWAELAIQSEAFINGDPSMWSVGVKGPSGWSDLIFASPDVKLTFSWNGEAYAN